MNWPKLITTIGLAVFLFQGIKAQSKVFYPNINDVRKGHIKSIKIPKIKDYQNFNKNYTKQLNILNRRSKKSYHKNFLKFIEIEDKLLHTLCDSNEFRANALMRSASAAYGKMEKNRNTKESITKNEDKIKIENALNLTEEFIPNINTELTKQAKIEHKRNQETYNSQFYTEYMNKRIGLYKTTFRHGTKQQKQLLMKLRKRALLWQSYKEEDDKLLNAFTDKNIAILKSMEFRSELVSALNPQMIDYSGTQLDHSIPFENFKQPSILESLQKNLLTDGIFNENDLSAITSTKELFKRIHEVKADLKDTTNTKDKDFKDEKPIKLNSKSSLRFWDRLYGGVDFDWQKSTWSIPEGLGVTLKGGYHISDNSGLNIEIQTVLDAAKIKRTENTRFETQFLSRYSIGANIDHRIWKIVYLGLGSEITTIQYELNLQDIHGILPQKHTIGIPLICKILLPVSGAKSTSMELRYDLNSKNNVKPKFDFKIGFLIGR